MMNTMNELIDSLALRLADPELDSTPPGAVASHQDVFALLVEVAERYVDLTENELDLSRLEAVRATVEGLEENLA